MHPDQKYIDALLNNDTALIEEIYKKYSGKIKAMVLKNNGTIDDASDIFQEGLIAILRIARRPNFVLTCPFDYLIYTICKNKWMSILTGKHSKVKFKDIDGYTDIKDDVDKHIEEALLYEKQVILFNKKFEELSDSCKRLLNLCRSGKSMKEIAEILNTTHGFVRKKKAICMARLIALIQQSPDFPSLKW